MEDPKNPTKRDVDDADPALTANSTLPLDVEDIEELDGGTPRVVFDQDDRFDFSDDDEYGDVDDMFK